MNKRLVLAFLLAAALPVRPQTAPPPPPSPPLVAEPAVGTSWRVTFHFDESSVAAQRLPATAAFHCAKNVTTIIVTWSDGSRTSAYIFGDRLVEQNGNAGPISSQQVQDDDPTSPLFTKGYPGVKWLALSNYKGQQMVGGGSAYYFASSTRAMDQPDLNLPAIKLEAWIGARDKVPVRIKLGDATYDFSAVEPASAEIDLPPDIAAFAKEISKEANALDIMRRNEQERH